MLALIRASGYEPTVATAQPILDVIQRDPDTLDDAYSALEELVTKGDHADIVSANVIIEAADSMSDGAEAGLLMADRPRMQPGCNLWREVVSPTAIHRPPVGCSPAKGSAGSELASSCRRQGYCEEDELAAEM